MNEKQKPSLLTKNQFIDAIVDKTNLTKKQCQEMFDTAYEVVIEHLKKGNKITIPNLGIIQKVSRSARKGRNPQTGAIIDIPAKEQIKFKISKSVKLD
ncbi:MAG: HU family DNA-binding protein [Mycoplasma sp.]|nr:HU family DNA-binding protein [Mycoplasma sp.]